MIVAHCKSMPTRMGGCVSDLSHFKFCGLGNLLILIHPLRVGLARQALAGDANWAYLFRDHFRCVSVSEASRSTPLSQAHACPQTHSPARPAVSNFCSSHISIHNPLSLSPHHPRYDERLPSRFLIELRHLGGISPVPSSSTRDTKWIIRLLCTARKHLKEPIFQS